MEHRLLVRTLGSAVLRNVALPSVPLVAPAQKRGRRSHEPHCSRSYPGQGMPTGICNLGPGRRASASFASCLSSAGRSTLFDHDSLDIRRTLGIVLRTSGRLRTGVL
jgi:hypothetical protein